MKYILVLVVVWVGYQLWRRARIAEQAEHERPRRDPAVPMVMVACAHCGTHLPQTDALALDGAFFCNADHRDRHVRP
jgi:uncharacterized protein